MITKKTTNVFIMLGFFLTLLFWNQFLNKKMVSTPPDSIETTSKMYEYGYNHSGSESRISNYSVVVPEGWSLGVSEYPMLDENGDATGEVGGAKVSFVHGSDVITISQNVMDYSFCSLDKSSAAKTPHKCFQYKKVQDDSLNFVIASPDEIQGNIPTLLFVCDQNYEAEPVEDDGICKDITGIGQISLRNESGSQRTVADFMAVLRSIEVKK